MNLTERLEDERTTLQNRLDTLLTEGAECLVKDGEFIVTTFYLDSFEILLAQPFFDRQTGKLGRVTWWCCLREVHFEGGMQRSHLMHVKVFDWMDDRNLSVTTDDFQLIVSALEPREFDPQGYTILQEWQAFKQDNPWLDEVAAETRSDFMETARRAVE